MDAIPFDFRLSCRRALDALLVAIPLLVSLLLVTRRLAGALVEPLPPAAWLLAGLVVAAWLRWSAIALAGRHLTIDRWQLPAVWPFRAVAVVVCIALWLPGTSQWAVAAYAALVALAGSPRVKVRWPHRSARTGRHSAGPRGPAGLDPAAAGSARFGPVASRVAVPDVEDATDETGLDDAEPLRSLPSAVVQQLIRRREPGAAESLRGSLRTDFVVGQRTASAHVAICPPFVRPPHCQAAVAAGPPAEVRVASLLPFGVRLEIKLGQPAPGPQSVVVEFAIDSTDVAAADHSPGTV